MSYYHGESRKRRHDGDHDRDSKRHRSDRDYDRRGDRRDERRSGNKGGGDGESERERQERLRKSAERRAAADAEAERAAVEEAAAKPEDRAASKLAAKVAEKEALAAAERDASLTDEQRMMLAMGLPVGFDTSAEKKHKDEGTVRVATKRRSEQKLNVKAKDGDAQRALSKKAEEQERMRERMEIASAQGGFGTHPGTFKAKA